MRGAASLWFAALAFTAAPASAQHVIGEIRMLGTAAWAPGTDAASRPASGYPLPESRALVGASAGLSFVSGGISAGPEALVLRGSDRKMFAVGGVARVGFTSGAFRPYLLLGAGGRERLSLIVEFRGHKSLNEDEWSGSRDALALSVGGRVSW